MHKRLYWLVVFTMPLMGGSHARYKKPSKQLAALNAALAAAGVIPVPRDYFCTKNLD